MFPLGRAGVRGGRDMGGERRGGFEGGGPKP